MEVLGKGQNTSQPEEAVQFHFPIAVFTLAGAMARKLNSSQIGEEEVGT